MSLSRAWAALITIQVDCLLPRFGAGMVHPSSVLPAFTVGQSTLSALLACCLPVGLSACLWPSGVLDSAGPGGPFCSPIRSPPRRQPTV
ncbi:hypothetical protein BO70DRAFT_357978 [Aspergillus heteromorphus CBS 117.55]|uniref:Uncharacterized protein n=1 Tax=Aspergillus heteromorphus CBS 117.55 TaxID=1448321 RepID=A0A317X5F5_9EURO|nr:uncharacterized protein BO70DRAFT_357978 [Aspergillus heteromorphus CBS 117.55]PWY92852.1 hypothetical protein BO70DRAFT_357978 [Aspergillus heteromorphus CBS 117.55]